MDLIPIPFDDYLSRFIDKIYFQKSLSTYEWGIKKNVTSNYFIALVENGGVNNQFHLIDLKTNHYVYDQQNKFFSKPDKRLVSKDHIYEIENKCIKYYDKTALVIGGQNNHWHFTINFLVRLFIVKQYSPTVLDKVDHVIIHGDPFPAQLEVLKRCFPDLTFKSALKDKWTVYRELYYPSMPKNTHFYIDTLWYIRETLHSVFNLSGEVPTNSIFIDRKFPHPRRRLSNKKNVIPILEANDIQVVDFDGCSAFEQAELMSCSKLVLGLHGAGLANLIYCREGTKVIIFDYKWPSEMQGLALTMGLEPITLLVEQAVDKEFELKNLSFNPRLRDLKIPPKQLDALLNSMS